LKELKDILWKNKNLWEYDLPELIIYIENLAKECVGKEQLNMKLGVYRDFLDRLIKKYDLNLKLDYNLSSTNPNFKAIYQNYDWCYEQYVIKGLSHDEMAKEANCSTRVIGKWCAEKNRLTQKYRQIHKQLNDTQKDLIVGSMLGDGHIDKREEQPMFIVVHAENQKDYLYWKYNLLKDFCNAPPVEKPAVIRYFPNNPKGYLCQKQYRFCTRLHDCLKYYRALNYSELLNLMNNFSFCIWMLDDAYRDCSNWELCVAEYTTEDVQLAIKLFKQKWGLKAWIEKDIRYLRFDAISSRMIDKIILEIIPNDFDIIQYKLLNNPKIRKEQNRITLDIDGNKIFLSDYCKENNLDYRKIINRTYSGYNLYESVRMEM